MRKSGMLLPIFSLPSPYGIGTFGESAYAFVDFLAAAGQSIWQILPLGPTGFGNSPYQSDSTFAGNPLLIDLDLLVKDGLLTESECAAFSWNDSPDTVDYDRVRAYRPLLFKTAFNRFFASIPADYEAFCEAESGWLSDYALFCALKDAHSGAEWQLWEPVYRDRDETALASFAAANKEALDYYKMLQYLFFRQWRALKARANAMGIDILGDLPIYVAMDSADVWSHRELFALNAEGKPTEVSGCPPDAFSEDGQKWGNPVYHWAALRDTDYAWWKARVRHACMLYDRVRIDHFRGFESYYCIPAEAENAKIGVWRKGPGMELFRTLENELGALPLIAEDLGFLTPAVYELLNASGYPGMRVMQFAFADVYGDSSYLPHNFIENCIAYTGTHDNDTILGWAQTARPDEWDFAAAYLGIHSHEEAPDGMLKALLASKADTVISQAQDWLKKGSEARINTPGTTEGNWCWRARSGDFSTEIAVKLLSLTQLYRR